MTDEGSFRDRMQRRLEDNASQKVAARKPFELSEPAAQQLRAGKDDLAREEASQYLMRRRRLWLGNFTIAALFGFALVWGFAWLSYFLTG